MQNKKNLSHFLSETEELQGGSVTLPDLPKPGNCASVRDMIKAQMLYKHAISRVQSVESSPMIGQLQNVFSTLSNLPSEAGLAIDFI